MSSVQVFEHAFYIGNYLSAILYGVQLVMFLSTVRILTRKQHRSRTDRFFLFYSTLLTVLVTIDIATNAVWGEMMWVTGPQRDGGVSAFIAQEVSVWYETLSSTSVVALIFLGDALLIYRLFILYESSYLIALFPALVYLAAFALAILELVQSGVPGGSFFGSKAINFGVPYYSMTIGLNVIVTALICARLFYLSRLIRNALHASQSDSTPASNNDSGINVGLYTSVMSIMIESAAPYSLLGIMFLVPYARGSPTSIAFGQVWAKITCLSPQLIVLRIITRRAWSRDTVGYAQGQSGSRMTSSRLVFTSGIVMPATTVDELDVDVETDDSRRGSGGEKAEFDEKA